MQLSQNKEYIEFCEKEAITLFHALNRLKIKRDNEETVDYFLKENKIKRKNYEIELEKLYSKCEFLMMRYSKDKDVVSAYKELNGDAQASWFFSLAYKSFLNKKESILSDNVSEMIEKIYFVPTWTAIWTRMLYD